MSCSKKSNIQSYIDNTDATLTQNPLKVGKMEEKVSNNQNVLFFDGTETQFSTFCQSPKLKQPVDEIDFEIAGRSFEIGKKRSIGCGVCDAICHYLCIQSRQDNEQLLDDAECPTQLLCLAMLIFMIFFFWIALPIYCCKKCCCKSNPQERIKKTQMRMQKSTYQKMSSIGPQLKGRRLKLVVKDNYLSKEKIDHIRVFIQNSEVKEVQFSNRAQDRSGQDDEWQNFQKNMASIMQIQGIKYRICWDSKLLQN